VFFFSYIRKLFLAAFPRPVIPWPLIQANLPRGAIPGNSLIEGRAFKPQPPAARTVTEPNLAAPLLLSRFRIGPYANGPP
jgi:hypothetical protein